MATPFAKMFYRAAAPVLMRQFGETVTYYPASGGAGRKIQAMVERQPLEVISELGTQVSEAILVRVRNNKYHGIASDTVDAGGDEIELRTEVDATPERRSVVRIIRDSNGFLTLLCQ